MGRGMYNRYRETYKEETMFTGFAAENQQQNRFQRLKDLIEKVKKGREKDVAAEDDDDEKIDFTQDTLVPPSSKSRKKLEYESDVACDTPRALNRPGEISDFDEDDDSFWERVMMVVTDSVDLSLAAYELLARAA
jgi:hypothetical protein